MAANLELVRRLIAAEHGLATVATIRPNGTVHASVVNAGILDDPVTGALAVGLVARGSARKLGYLRQSRWITVVWRFGWEWVGVEGTARLAGPNDPLEGFDPERLPELLRAVFRGAGGTHEDWNEYDRVMAAEERTAVLVAPERIFGN